jgi:hypothetical protein
MIFKSKRWCRVCERVTQFNLNKAIQHSECTECGMRASYKLPEDVIIVLERQLKGGRTISVKQYNNLQKAYKKLLDKYKKLLEEARKGENNG